MIRQLTIILFVALLLSGCVANGGKATDRKSEFQQLIVIDTEKCNGDTTIMLSSLIDSLQVIKLGHGSAPTGHVYKVAASDNYELMIPYSNADSVKLFDLAGNTLFAIPMPAYEGNLPSFVDAAIDEPRKRVYLSKQGEIVAYNFDGSEDKTYSIDQIHNPSLFLYPDGELAVVSICFVNLSDTVAVAHFNPDMTINGVDDITVCHYPPLQDTGSSLVSLYNVTDTKSVASKMLFSLILTTDTTYYYDKANNKVFPHVVLHNFNRQENALQYAGELPTGYVGGSQSIEKAETYWLDKESGEVKNVTFHNDFIGEKMHPYYLFDDNYQQVFNLRHHRDYFRNILNGNPLTDAQRQRIEAILDTPDDCLVILRGKMTQNNQ